MVKNITPSRCMKPKTFGIFKIPIVLILIILQAAVFSTRLLAQEYSIIKGKVTDRTTNEVLIGASVSIPSIRLGAIVDKKGNFNFECPPGIYTIEARYIGYEPLVKKVTVKLDESVAINFEMSSQSIQTSEIVIVGLTGEVDRDKLGNTISSLSSRDVAKVVSPSAIDAISGRIPGVSVTRNSGTPGAGTFITMRGRKTILGSSEPLYVIDGIIMDNSSIYDPSGTKQFSNRAVDINPADIESMEILKGASAAAIYGSQAANGVVLITTKRGKLSSFEKPARVTYNSSVTTDIKAGNVPLQTEYGQTSPYKPGIPGQTPGITGSSTSWGAKLAPKTQTYKQDEVPFRAGLTHEQSLSITGGVPQFDYLVNGTYQNTQGYVQGSSYERSSVRANIGTSLFPGVTMQLNNNYIMINNDLPQDGSNTSGLLLGALRTPPEFNNSIYLEPNGEMRRFAGYDNPIWSEKFNTFNSKINRFLHSTELSWKPTDWITLLSRVGIDRYEYKNIERLAVGSAASENGAGNIDHSSIANNQTNLDFTATFTDKWFDDALDLGLMVGGQTIWSNRASENGNGSNTLPFYNQLSASSVKDAASQKFEKKVVGIFGQLTSTLWNRASLTLALRRDGSSTFGLSKKFHYYPKAGISYVLSEEPFMKGSSNFIDRIRIRATYGEAGSPNLPTEYATNFLYGTAGFFDSWGRNTNNAGRGEFAGIRHGGGLSGESIAAGAINIRPELTIEKEIGFDLGFLDNTLALEFTYYYSNVYDMILSVPVATSSGYDQELKNAAEMWNKGYEVMLKANPFASETFSWTTAINYSTNKNQVTKLNVKQNPKGDEYVQLNGGFTGISNIARKGEPLGVFLSYGWLRDENGKVLYSGDKVRVDGNNNYIRAQNGGVIRDNSAQGFTLVADYKNKFIGAPMKDPNLKIIGDPNPDFQIGWRNDMTIYKDLTVSFLIEGVFGQDVWNGTKGALYHFGTSGDTKDRDQNWINFDGQAVMDISDPNNPVPVKKKYYYDTYANGFANNINEPQIEKGSFIKMREITLEYRWDGLQDWSITALTFSFSARNVFKITDYTGYDPEVSTFSQAEGRGFDYFTLPQVRSYRFGISLLY